MGGRLSLVGERLLVYVWRGRRAWDGRTDETQDEIGWKGRWDGRRDGAEDEMGWKDAKDAGRGELKGDIPEGRFSSLLYRLSSPPERVLCEPE